MDNVLCWELARAGGKLHKTNTETPPWGLGGQIRGHDSTQHPDNLLQKLESTSSLSYVEHEL